MEMILYSYSDMDTVAQILAGVPAMLHQLQGFEQYLAHISEGREPESLTEHIVLVNSYLGMLIDAHGLEPVIDELAADIAASWSGDERCASFIKTMFVHTIVFHDFGKINEYFQAKRLQNPKFRNASRNGALDPPHGHSLLGAYLYCVHHIQKIKEVFPEDGIVPNLHVLCVSLSYNIQRHHSSSLDDAMQADHIIRMAKDADKLQQYAEAYGFSASDYACNVLKNIVKIADAVRGQTEINVEKGFAVYVLCRLGFSLLTAADYLATHEYMSGDATTDMGVLHDDTRRQEIITHFRSYKHNAGIFGSVGDLHFRQPQEVSGGNLNILRLEMAVELTRTIRNHADARLFYIEAPTGGGKTNLSVIAATELLDMHKELNKVYYVFPFTTLITQTTTVLKSTLDLRDDELAELHSKAGIATKTREQNEDGFYGRERKDHIDNLFALFPFTLLSHVRFFDILKTDSKESNYLLHRIANSVVVIDEIQSYNPAIWDKMLYFISRFAHYFNVRFILMSATLPKISTISIGLTQQPAFVDLLPGARQYISNPNFSRRVVFNFDLLSKKMDMDALVDHVLATSDSYAAKHGSVKTIIEFIYKNSATAFAQAVSSRQPCMFEPDNILLLSGTILDGRRKAVINRIKRSAGENVNILLVTTQVVEAGVDIDMDIGYKNRSLLDADEQLAGRVNRNAGKEENVVYLFDYDDATILYGKDYRYRQTQTHISVEQYRDILQAKDFRRLYDGVIELIDKGNNPVYKESIENYTEDVARLKYKNVNGGFEIIDQDAVSVFVPVKLPATVEGIVNGSNEQLFSDRELAFLAHFGIELQEGKLDGAMVWGAYKLLIEGGRGGNTKFDIGRITEMKMMHRILSQFTFSLLSVSRQVLSITAGFGYEEYGYIYFSHWNEERTNGKPYCYEQGLNSKAFSDSNFI